MWEKGGNRVSVGVVKPRRINGRELELEVGCRLEILMEGRPRVNKLRKTVPQVR